MKTTQPKPIQLSLDLGNEHTQHLDPTKRQVVLQILAQMILQAFEEANREDN